MSFAIMINPLEKQSNCLWNVVHNDHAMPLYNHNNDSHVYIFQGSTSPLQ